MRRLLPVLVCAAAALGGMSCGKPKHVGITPEDEKALAEIRKAYLKAVNDALPSNGASIAAFADRYLAADFHGTLLAGQRVRSAAEFRDELDRMIRFFEEKGGPVRADYRILEMEVRSRHLSGDTLVSVGLTRDRIQAASKGMPELKLSREIRFETRWTVMLRREGEGWKIAWAHHEVAGADPGTVEAKAWVRRAAMHLLKGRGGATD